MVNIWDHAYTLVKREQCFVLRKSDQRVYFLVRSETLRTFIEETYIILEDRFLPCLSPHGESPLGGWIPEVKGYHCRHLLACRILMEKNGMRDEFEKRRAEEHYGEIEMQTPEQT
jgi:hypothetical protein